MLSCGLSLTYCNLYDPHVFPSKGPFFEGWYIRIVDTDRELSFGVICGLVKPQDPKSKLPVGYVGLLYSAGETDSKLVHIDTYPSQESIFITVQNQPVKHDPDYLSPPDFAWIAADGALNMTVKPGVAYFSVTSPEGNFSATLKHPTPWGTDGKGPMGSLNALPLPLSWFVYSVSSTVTEYKWTDSSKAMSSSGGNVYADMEKNWGYSFPDG